MSSILYSGQFGNSVRAHYFRCTVREIAVIWLTKVSLNCHDIPWKILASTEVIMPQILLYSFIEMVMKAPSITQNGLVLHSVKHWTWNARFTKGFLGNSGPYLKEESCQWRKRADTWMRMYVIKGISECTWMGRRSEKFTLKSVSCWLRATGCSGPALRNVYTCILSGQFLLRACGKETWQRESRLIPRMS